MSRTEFQFTWYVICKCKQIQQHYKQKNIGGGVWPTLYISEYFCTVMCLNVFLNILTDICVLVVQCPLYCYWCWCVHRFDDVPVLRQNCANSLRQDWRTGIAASFLWHCTRLMSNVTSMFMCSKVEISVWHLGYGVWADQCDVLAVGCGLMFQRAGISVWRLGCGVWADVPTCCTVDNVAVVTNMDTQAWCLQSVLLVKIATY